MANWPPANLNIGVFNPDLRNLSVVVYDFPMA